MKALIIFIAFIMLALNANAQKFNLRADYGFISIEGEKTTINTHSYHNFKMDTGGKYFIISNSRSKTDQTVPIQRIVILNDWDNQIRNIDIYFEGRLPIFVMIMPNGDYFIAEKFENRTQYYASSKAARDKMCLVVEMEKLAELKELEENGTKKL